MPRTLHDDQLAARDLFVQVLAVFDRRHAIRIAAEDESRGRDAAHVSAAVECVARDEVVVNHLGRHLAQPPRVKAQQIGVRMLAVRPLRQQLGRSAEVAEDAGQDLRRDAQLGAGADEKQARQPRRVAQSELLGDRPAHGMPAQDERREL